MGDCHNLYLKTDVLLLADIFEKFIDAILEYCGLDPCHYFSSTGLSWDAMLKMTGIELEILTCICLLRTEWGEVFLTLLKDIAKQIINACKHMILINQVSLLNYSHSAKLRSEDVL